MVSWILCTYTSDTRQVFDSRLSLCSYLRSLPFSAVSIADTFFLVAVPSLGASRLYHLKAFGRGKCHLRAILDKYKCSLDPSGVRVKEAKK